MEKTPVKLLKNVLKKPSECEETIKAATTKESPVSASLISFNCLRVEFFQASGSESDKLRQIKSCSWTFFSDLETSELKQHRFVEKTTDSGENYEFSWINFSRYF